MFNMFLSMANGDGLDALKEEEFNAPPSSPSASRTQWSKAPLSPVPKRPDGTSPSRPPASVALIGNYCADAPAFYSNSCGFKTIGEIPGEQRSSSASSARGPRLRTASRLSAVSSISSTGAMSDSGSEGGDLDAEAFYQSLRRGVVGIDYENNIASRVAATNAAASAASIPGIVTIRPLSRNSNGNPRKLHDFEDSDDEEFYDLETERADTARAEDEGLMYFGTGIHVNDILDSMKHPMPYKTQYTVTGAMRRIKDKKNWVKTGKQVEINGRTLALFRYGRAIYAIEDKCPHQGAPLSGGDVADIEDMNGECVSCPYHGWKFNLRTGRCSHNENIAQPVYPVKILRGGEVGVGFREISTSLFDCDDDADF